MAMVPPTVTHQEKQVHVVKGKPVFYEPADLKAARQKLMGHLAGHRPEQPFDRGVRLMVKWCFPKGKHADGEYRITKPDIAAANASRLLRNAKVAAYISERMQERQKRTEVTQDRVIEELAAIAFAKATDFVQISHGNVILTDTSKLSENQIKAIAGIKEGKNGIELKLNDKEKALELLGRHLGMFKDKLEVTGLEAEQTKLDDLIRQMRGGG